MLAPVLTDVYRYSSLPKKQIKDRQTFEKHKLYIWDNMGQYGIIWDNMVCIYIYIYDIKVDLRHNQQKRRCSLNQDLTASRGETSIKNQAWLCEWGSEFLHIYAYLYT